MTLPVRQERSAAGIVYRATADGLVWLVLLDGHGNWGFPKGHLEAEETDLDAALREVAEEVGLNDLRLEGHLADSTWSFEHRGTCVKKSCANFVFESSEENLVLQASEGITDACWLAAQEIPGKLTFDTARSVFAEALLLTDRGEA